MAKQEPPKKRGRKLLSPDAKEFPQSKSARKILKPFKDSSLPGEIKKPVHPGFTFMGFHRGSARDIVGGQNRSSLTQGGGVKNLMSPVGSPTLNKSGQNRNFSEGKLPISSISSGTNLELKAAVSKSKEVATLNSNSSKSPIQGTMQQTLASPNGPKKPQAPASTPQRTPNNKATASLPPKISTTVNSGLQPLNLQNKQSGNRSSPVRNTANPAKKILAQNQECSPPKTPATRKNHQDKVAEEADGQSPRVQGRLEKNNMQKSSSELQQERSASKDGKKKNDMSTGEDESSSDSEQDCAGQNSSVTVQNQDWKPTRSLIEHVFVTDVTANLVTVTVKESPTSVGFFSIRNY